MTQPTATAPPTRPARLDSLTGLRWWAAFAVFAHHMTNLAPLPIHDVVGFGKYGVTLFFVLSGFVLTWSARPGVTAPTFYWRRFARIYPAHFVALLLAIPVFYSLTPDPAQGWVKPVSVGVLLLSVPVIQGWWRDPVLLYSGNPAAWTLTCEFFFYTLFPPLHRVFRRLRLRGALVATALGFAAAFGYRVLVWSHPESWAAQLPLPVVRLSEFVIGIAIARAMLSGWRVRIAPIWVFLGSAALIGWLTTTADRPAAGTFEAFVRVTKEEWIIFACAAMIATVAWRDLTGRRSLLRTRPLVLLGEWSYAFYLVHATFLYTARDLLGKEPVAWSNLQWYAALLVVSLAGAAALHYAVERPLERRLRGWWDRRREATAAIPAARTSDAPQVREPAAADGRHAGTVR
ncbi:acyltransferase [Streptomyces sp. NPDC000410]|uniref:acyltransferase family protein n=1 Tax=Streptomyces sp. NPDC000410 TaxID=3154254 RepID=UPI003323EF58